MIAVGDICLAIEEQFEEHLDTTMTCLNAAASITLSPPQNFESEEIMNRLRDSVVDAYISVIHGMQSVS